MEIIYYLGLKFKIRYYCSIQCKSFNKLNTSFLVHLKVLDKNKRITGPCTIYQLQNVRVSLYMDLNEHVHFMTIFTIWSYISFHLNLKKNLLFHEQWIYFWHCGSESLLFNIKYCRCYCFTDILKYNVHGRNSTSSVYWI